MKPFSFHSPTSLPEALGLLEEHGPAASPLAGGTDLLVQMRQGDREPRALISLRRLPELQGMHQAPDGAWHIGATTTLRQLTREPAIQRHHPSLAQAASLMASEQVRSLATLGGNLCNGSPAADLAPPLIALGAEVRIAGLQGERAVPLEVFFLGPGATALQPGKLLIEVIVPPPQGRCLYVKHTARAYMDIPIVGVAARLSMRDGVVDEARIVLGAVAPTPVRAREAERSLEGGSLTHERIRAASELAVEASSPISDLRASEGYRRRVLRVLVERALQSLGSNGRTA
jgi:carbon-monoxide dehydrogenase medium subunit